MKTIKNAKRGLLAALLAGVFAFGAFPDGDYASEEGISPITMNQVKAELPRPETHRTWVLYHDGPTGDWTCCKPKQGGHCTGSPCSIGPSGPDCGCML